MRIGGRIWLCLFAVALLVSGAIAQELRSLPSTLLEKIPADLREQARDNIRIADSTQEAWRKRTPEQIRETVIRELTAKPAAAEFLLDLLPKETSLRNRLNIINEIPYRAHLRNNIRTRSVLADLVLVDKDTDVVKLALDRLRWLEINELDWLLDKRIAAEKSAGDSAMLAPLLDEQERWQSLRRGSMLPGFMRAIPSVFFVKGADKPIRIVAFGDFGRGTTEQKQTAETIIAEHKRKPFDFGITLGDNFYPRGMDSPTDPRWHTHWEQLYGPLNIKFYASLGNHDWYGYDSVASEIMYSRDSRSWRLPAPYYTYTAGPVQLFVVDTDDVSEKQRQWLAAELGKSTAKWKIVYGHHPIYAASTFGKSYTEPVRNALLSIIKGRAAIYISGHHHSLQHLAPDGGTQFFIVGGGGASVYPVGEKDEERGEPVLFAKSAFGFAIIEVSETAMTFKFFGSDGNQLYSYSSRK